MREFAIFATGLSLFVGLGSCVTCFSICLSIPLGLLGILCGAVGLSITLSQPWGHGISGPHWAFAATGIILSLIGPTLSIAAIALFVYSDGPYPVK